MAIYESLLDNLDLVKELIRKKYITSERIEEAFMNVDRGFFVPENLRDNAYYDEPLPIGFKQTISAPSIVAVLLMLIDVQPENSVLEIGTGSGYNACLLAALGNKVITIERIPELKKLAQKNIEKCPFKDKITVMLGDGSVGHKANAPYDRILVTCGAPSIPHPLVEQLNDPGKMVIPVGGMMFQELYVVKKEKEKLTKKIWGDVTFVPLIGTHGHRWA
jgi:protein-L-isoaspartate(D-aspartate) O-methyltransferase